MFLYFIDWCFFMFRFVCVCVSACLLYVSPCREGPFLDVQRNLLVTFNILMFLLRALWILHVLIHFYGVVVVMGRSILLCFFLIFGVPWLGYECYELRLRLCLYYPNRYCIVFLVYVGVVCLDLSFLVCFGPWKHLLARRGYVELVPVVCILNQMV